MLIFFFQAEDGIRDLVRSRGLGDVYKRQGRLCLVEQGAVRNGFDDAAGQRDDQDREYQGHQLSLIHI